MNKNVNMNGLCLSIHFDPQISLSVSLINIFFWLETSTQKSIWVLFLEVKWNTLRYVEI